LVKLGSLPRIPSSIGLASLEEFTQLTILRLRASLGQGSRHGFWAVAREAQHMKKREACNALDGQHARRSSRTTAAIDKYNPSDYEKVNTLAKQAAADKATEAGAGKTMSNQMAQVRMGKRRIFGVAAIAAQAKAMRQPIGKGQSLMRVAEADPTAFSPVVVRKSGAWVAPPDVAAVQAETAAAMRRRPKHTAQQLLAEATHLTLSEARLASLQLVVDHRGARCPESACFLKHTRVTVNTECDIGATMEQITKELGPEPFTVLTVGDSGSVEESGRTRSITRPNSRRVPVDSLRVPVRVRHDEGQAEAAAPHADLYLEHLAPGTVSAGAPELIAAWIKHERLAQSFHGKGVEEGNASGDPEVANQKTIEIGWSAFHGSAAKQMRVSTHGEAYERNANDALAGSSLEKYARELCQIAWARVVREFPEQAAEMQHQAGKYGLWGTGFSKVTLGVDNATTAHCGREPDRTRACLCHVLTWRHAVRDRRHQLWRRRHHRAQGARYPGRRPRLLQLRLLKGHCGGDVGSRHGHCLGARRHGARQL
jgi:hypothetical protein